MDSALKPIPDSRVLMACTSNHVPTYSTNDPWIKLMLGWVKPMYDTDIHRVYHTWDHIESCIYHLRILGLDLNDLDYKRCFIALIYHDAIYIQGYSGNEEASAALFTSHLALLQATSAMEYNLDTVSSLIMSTRIKQHLSLTCAPYEQNRKLVMDCDLNALAMPVYDVFEQVQDLVRGEAPYTSDSIEQIRKGQSSFLEKFLNKPRIFHTDRAHDLGYEDRARSNITEFVKRHG